MAGPGGILFEALVVALVGTSREADADMLPRCYTPRRTRTNQPDHRPLRFLLQRRLGFAQVFQVTLRIVEAFRRLTLGSP
jgi:hypothetical protein